MPTPYPTSSRGISHYSTLVNVPDSITTWQLVAVSLKAGFLSCCHLSEALTREAREEQLLLGTCEEAMAGGRGLGLA